MGEKFVPKGPKRYAHQRRGLMKMIQTKGIFALLFDPGTGKTMTTLDYMSILALKAEPDDAGVRETRVLVVAPLSALDTWVIQAEQYVADSVSFWAEAIGGDRMSVRQRAEALAARGGRPFKHESKTRKKHGPRGIHFEKALMLRSRGTLEHGHQADGPDSLGIDKPRLIIMSVNLDTFSQRQQVGTSTSTIADVLLDAVERFAPDLVVVDESHKIKGATSNVSRMLARIGRRVPRRGILTGTVMPAGPLDVFGQWRFVDPYAFGDVTPEGEKKTATYDGFRRRYAEMGGYLGKQVTGYKNLDELQRIMSVHAEVAKKADALDLPDTTQVIVPVNLSPAETKAYAEMKKGLATQLSTGLHSSSSNRLSQMMKLRQITSGHVPDDLGNLNVLGDAKAQVIRSLVYDTLAGEDRIVVFALFLYEIEMLRKILKSHANLGEPATELMTITGATDPQERRRMRARFGYAVDADGAQVPPPKGSDRSPLAAPGVRIVMIAQVRTMSLSVNELVTANHAIYGSLPQDRSDFIQSQDRLDRIGQVRPVTFWFALAPDTIDEVIFNAHKTRTSLEAAVLRHIYDGDENAVATAEANALRRDEEEQEHQVGRLVEDSLGNIDRRYGDQVESVKVAEAPVEEVPPTDEELQARFAARLIANN